jgi:hypothetical protein
LWFVFWFRTRGLQVCDYFFAGALAPAVVVVCGKPVLAAALVNLLAGAARPKAEADTGPWCSALRGIDPEVARAPSPDCMGHGSVRVGSSSGRKQRTLKLFCPLLFVR